MPKEPRELDPNEAEAAREFQAKTRGRAPRVAVDPAVARQNAQQAAEAAKVFLAANPPQLQPDAPVEPAETTDAIAASAPVVDETTCGCGKALGQRVFGVQVAGAWYCPTCFMRVKDFSTHATARAVNCPTCGCQAVDFTGRNKCPVCRSPAAQPVRAA